MYYIIPEDMRKLRAIFRPYLDGGGLRADAPEEAVKAYEKYMKWAKERLGDNQ